MLHIILKCQKASYSIHKIRLIRHSLTVVACRQIVYGMVLSHLDYCNGIYMGLPKVDILRMQMTQNAAAKLVFNWDKSASSTEALKALHWLPIKWRIIYKILTVVHKCLYGEAPIYLKNLIELKKASAYSLKSNQCEYTEDSKNYSKNICRKEFQCICS